MTIGTLLEGAFEAAPKGRKELIELARENGADPAALAALGRLERPEYRELRELWRELADLPLGRPQLISNG